jgi:hypothetical protein
MTAIDLRASINDELSSMSLNMLEKVAEFVKSLTGKSTHDHSVSPLVSSMLTGHSVNLSDEELDTLKMEHLKEKYL